MNSNLFRASSVVGILGGLLVGLTLPIQTAGAQTIEYPSRDTHFLLTRSPPHGSLTPRTNGAPTAGQQAWSGATRYIFASPGLAFWV